MNDAEIVERIRQRVKRVKRLEVKAREDFKPLTLQYSPCCGQQLGLVRMALGDSLHFTCQRCKMEWKCVIGTLEDILENQVANDSRVHNKLLDDLRQILDG